MFDAAPELWRAHICVELIQRAQVGDEITATDAYAILHGASIQILDPTQAIAAITTYLTNLRQRGILAHPQGNTSRFVATGAGLS